MAITLDGTTGITTPDSISHNGDTNTAIRFPAADTVTVETGGTERLRVDGGGNAGLGVTPVNNLLGKTFQIGQAGVWTAETGSNRWWIGSNWYYGSSADRYITTGHATLYSQQSGDHYWYSAPSGTANNPVTFTQTMSLTSSGSLLVGTTSVTSGKLNVVQGTSSALTVLSQSSASGDGGTSNTAIRSTNLIGTSWANTRYDAYTHTWGIGGSASANSAMILTSDGSLLVGTTSGPTGSTGGSGFLNQSLGRKILRLASTSTATGAELIQFWNPNGQVGRIETNASSTTYATSSDYRLKEDWQPMTGASERVLALKPVNFAWKVDGSRVDGFLAHEAQEVVPEAVSGTKDAMRDEEYEVTPAVLDDEGNVVTEAVMGIRSVPVYQGIDQSKIVPLLTAALQEALTKIEALEARLTALETTA